MQTCFESKPLNYKFASLFIGNSYLNGEFLAQHFQLSQGPVFILSEESVKQTLAERLAVALNARLFTLPGGESSKSEPTKALVETWLFASGCTKNATLIAIGGGAVTDLAGFIASTFMRGIDLILIPSSLLAMVDACIGGKTAINTSMGKNLIGTYYHPKGICIDTHLLKTLPDIEWLNGLSEVLKMGLIADESLWTLIETSLESPSLFLDDLTLIEKAVRGKIHIVEQDPFETGLRRALNFGHTIAHALEVLSDFEMPHGQAVALGSTVEAHLSLCFGKLSAEAFSRILNLYSSLYDLKLPKGYSEKAFLKALAFDKKRLCNKTQCVFLQEIGSVDPFDNLFMGPVLQSELQPSLRWMEGLYG